MQFAWVGILFLLAACARDAQPGLQTELAVATLTATQAAKPQVASASATPANQALEATPTAVSAGPTTAPTLLPSEAPTQITPPATAEPSATPAQEEPPSPTQTAIPPESSATPTEAGCKDAAVFVGDISIPDGTSVRQGDKFVKTWRIQNAGSCTWGREYSLVFASGEVMNAALSNPLPDTSPGGMVDISIDFTAPARGGTFRSYWEFQNPAGQRFGVAMGGPGWIWVEINVSFVLPTADAGISPTPAPAGICPAQRDSGVEAAILGSINQARQENGLGPLTLQEQLSAAAYQHSLDMACHGFVNHSGSDGSTWYDRVAAQGYANFASARENIYVGDPQFDGGAPGAFKWWWNSQIHKDNILFEHVSEIGIAYVYDADSEYKGYYTAVFARP